MALGRGGANATTLNVAVRGDGRRSVASRHGLTSVVHRTRWATGNDRLLAGSRFVAVFGELHVPPLEALADALDAILCAGPHTRIGLAPHPSKRFWRNEGSAPPVFSLPEDIASGSLTTILEYVRCRPVERRQLEVHASDRYLVLDIDHGLGDAKLALDLTAAIFAHANGYRSPWVDSRDTPLALPRAMLSTFAHPPSRAVTALKGLANLRNRQKPDSVGTGQLGVSWAPSLAVSLAQIDADAEEAVEEWRRTSGENLSSASVWSYVARRALLAAGLDMQDRMMFAVDLRRYLPKGHAVNGNFVIGLPLSFSADETLPRFNTRVRGIVASAVPLAAQAAIAARAVVGARETSNSSTIRRGLHSAEVMYTDLGRITTLDAAPWRDARLCVATGLIDPAGPCSVTILNTKIGARRCISISYHDNVFGRGLMDTAANYMCDPVQFLVSAAVRLDRPAP